MNEKIIVSRLARKLTAVNLGSAWRLWDVFSTYVENDAELYKNAAKEIELRSKEDALESMAKIRAVLKGHLKILDKLEKEYRAYGTILHDL